MPKTVTTLTEFDDGGAPIRTVTTTVEVERVTPDVTEGTGLYL